MLNAIILILTWQLIYALILTISVKRIWFKYLSTSIRIVSSYIWIFCIQVDTSVIITWLQIQIFLERVQFHGRIENVHPLLFCWTHTNLLSMYNGQFKFFWKVAILRSFPLNYRKIRFVEQILLQKRLKELHLAFTKIFSPWLEYLSRCFCLLCGPSSCLWRKMSFWPED